MSIFPTAEANSFVKLFGGTRDSEGKAMISQTGSYTLVGSYGMETPSQENNSSLSYYDMYIAHTDKNGNLKWQMAVTRPEENNNSFIGYAKLYQTEGVDIVERSAESWLALATVSPLPDAPIFDARIALVSIQSQQVADTTDFTFLAKEGFDAKATKLISTPDGGFLVLGQLLGKDINGAELKDIWLVKLDANLEIQWEREIDNQANEDYPATVKSLPGGGFALLFSTFATQTDFSFSPVIMILDNNGDIVSEKALGGDYNQGIDLEISGQDIFLLSSVEDFSLPTGGFARIYKLDRGSLNMEIFAEFTSTEGQFAFATAFDRATDGSFIVASASSRAFLDQPSTDPDKQKTTYDFMIQKIEADGSAADPNNWPVYIGDDGEDIPYAIRAISGETDISGYVVSGTMGFGPSGTMALIKLDANGEFSP